MTKLQKTQQILNLIVSMAGAIVALSEIWNKISPQVKRTVGPIVEDCKKLIEDTMDDEDDSDEDVEVIEHK